MQLVVAEKPSVAQTIAKVIGAEKKGDGCIIGNGYIVSWCVGHLVGLALPEMYDDKYKQWEFDTLPIMPEKFKFSVKQSTKKQFDVLKNLMSDSKVDEIICATDAGREGECIFRYVYNVAKCKKPFKRLWVSSMEEAAIKEAFGKLRDSKDYDNLYSAGLCRSKADWLVGINATRLFTLRYGTKLAIGRVKTPTLAMLAERENKIKDFIKEKYYTVEIGTVENPFFAASERIDDKAQAEKLLAACNGSSATVTSVKTEKKTANPPKLYDLTTLQREANRYYGYTAQQTLDYVQSLYEAKLCTYPRTDSQYITEDMHDTFLSVTDDVAKEFTGISSDSTNVKPIINNSKVSDHHALLITAEVKQRDLSSLPAGEKNVLFLIAARMVLASSTPHIYEATSLKLSCGDSEFSASGKVICENGWKEQERILKSKIKNENAEAEPQDNEKALPQLAESDVISVSARTAEHFTSPPKPYTEDTLLSAMETAGNKDYSEDSDVEKKGLGTPATRAGIIEELIKNGYIERNKKQLVPTEVGISLIKVVPDEVKSPKMTADWETRLQAIEKGDENAAVFLEEICGYIGGLVADYGSVDENSSFKQNEPEMLGSCPNCGNDIKKGKYGCYCTGKCGMNVAKVYGKELNEAQLLKLLDGKEISYTSKGKKTTVLPECEPYSYTGKDGKEHSGFQWKTASK